MSDSKIECVGVVGLGTIGASWVAYFLAHGLDVIATDPDARAQDRLMRMMDVAWPVLERFGLADGASPDRLRFVGYDLDAVAEAEFVQENGPERLDEKIALFRRLDALLPASVIIASSSSGLLISQIQAQCAQPQRCLIGHPFNPPHLIPLVEVVGGGLTDPGAIERAMAFYTAIGKHPIHIRREVPGHVANRLQAALWREAVHLVTTGVASVADVDAAVAYGPGLRWSLMGPSLTFHLAGGDGGIDAYMKHFAGPMQDWWDDLGAPRLDAAAQSQVVDGVKAAVAGRATSDLARARDTFLADLFAVLQRHRIAPHPAE